MEVLEMIKQASRQKRTKVIVLAVGGVVLAMVLVIAVLASALNNQKITIEDQKEQIALIKEQLAEAEKIDVAYIGNKLETISELTTAKMTYNGVVHYKDEGKIAFFDKKEFYMLYRVSIKAGFDLSKADIQVTEQTVQITLPAPEIYEPVVYEDAFQFLDKSYGLFAHEDMDDLTEVIKMAKEDALAQPETENMKETAREQAVILIRGLFEGLIGNRELIVNVK